MTHNPTKTCPELGVPCQKRGDGLRPYKVRNLTSDRNRTGNLGIRSPTLCPIEPRRLPVQYRSLTAKPFEGATKTMSSMERCGVVLDCYVTTEKCDSHRDGPSLELLYYAPKDTPRCPMLLLAGPLCCRRQSTTPPRRFTKLVRSISKRRFGRVEFPYYAPARTRRRVEGCPLNFTGRHDPQSSRRLCHRLSHLDEQGGVPPLTLKSLLYRRRSFSILMFGAV